MTLISPNIKKVIKKTIIQIIAKIFKKLVLILAIFILINKISKNDNTILANKLYIYNLI